MQFNPNASNSFKNILQTPDIIELFYPTELAITVNEAQRIEQRSTTALTTLGQYTLQRTDWSRFAKLLLTLRWLSSRSFELPLKRLFMHIVDSVIDSN